MKNSRLVEFTRALLESRLSREVGLDTLTYLGPGGVSMSTEEFWRGVETVDSTIEIRPFASAGRWMLRARALDTDERSLWLDEVHVHQAALRKLAQDKNGPFAFAIEGSAFQLGFAEFLAWMEQYDLGDYGAYNGNWQGPSRQGEPWTLVLTIV